MIPVVGDTENGAKGNPQDFGGIIILPIGTSLFQQFGGALGPVHLRFCIFA